ncbi:MAG: hypothetical protein M1840_000512 [Geoglossum simile]|nr:MAG: hypothetical protein M1840_000512 [Geoglossum simile]
MTSYLTSILTTTTSRYTSLKRSLLPDESDGDTEDDSHISRVLRAYYTEKGRPFPQWLPPDPKTPQAPPPQPMYLNNPAGAGVGRGAVPVGRGGALSDLWDSPQQQEESLSLRRGGRGPGRMQNLPPPGPASGGIVNSYARPLPSQRAGSYQSQLSQSSASQGRGQDNHPSPPSSSGSGVTAQERLKARLWGGGSATGRSERTSGSAKPSQSAPSPSPSLSSGRTPAGSSQSAPSPPPSLPRGRTPVGYERPGPSVGGGIDYSSRGNRSDANDNDKPYVGSSAPWSTGKVESGGQKLEVGRGRSYGDRGGSDGGGNGREPGGGGRGMGMNSGRVIGLPSGPRYK